ncbi:probable RNA polymerase II nuclear localization protein SLC7A6OS [Paramacrobiotus metropolitanus]|uniref:probable RNA polymerase II nuclear localization protein SLC7A6OS n=1 Tax=Paramacrobiotus metropolitanus TaxID=2943436 RepID=UPI0024459A52|nr:probable RNA polymerase II nuclear localization protein SLC7A6OS [Paramacrobiotus metropolitanus]
MSQKSEARMPLVVRVKRSADEEPLDVLRLRPLPSKLARGDQGAFELHSLQFKHAGTIAGSESIASSTVNLMKNLPASLHSELPVGMLNEPVRALSMEEQFDILCEFRQAADNTKNKKAQQMFMVTRKFRPVAVDALGSLAQQMRQSTLQPPAEAAGVGEGSNGTPAAQDVEMAYAVCDLQQLGHSEKRCKRARTDGGGAQTTDQQMSGITCNDEELIRESTENLDTVYDIYVLHHQADIGSSGSAFYQDVNHFLSDTEVILGTNSDNVLWSDAAESARVMQEELLDEEDSNDENNWRNDYPDETSEDSSDDGESGNEEDYYGYMAHDHDYFGQKLHRRQRMDEADSDEENAAEGEDNEGF